MHIAHKCGVAVAPAGSIFGIVLSVPPHAGIEGCLLILVARYVFLEFGGCGGVPLVDGGAGSGADGDDEVGGESEEKEK